MLFEYKVERLPVEAIINYLSCIDKIVTPSLSSRLNINDFALKLYKFAIHFCVYDGNKLVGFSACYFNNKSKGGFISTFSIRREYQGCGIANQLLNIIIKYGIENGIKEISLEVFISNLQAIYLYTKYGFLETYRSKNLLSMSLDIQKLGNSLSK